MLVALSPFKLEKLTSQSSFLLQWPEVRSKGNQSIKSVYNYILPFYLTISTLLPVEQSRLSHLSFKISGTKKQVNLSTSKWTLVWLTFPYKIYWTHINCISQMWNIKKNLFCKRKPSDYWTISYTDKSIHLKYAELSFHLPGQLP